MTEAYLPPYYEERVFTPKEGAILDLPMGKVPSRYYLYYQMYHHHPIMEGIVSRTPENAYDYIENEPLLRSIRDCGSSALPPVDTASISSKLNSDIIHQIIIHKSLLKPQALAAWSNLQENTPAYEDEDIAVFNTTASLLLAPGSNQLLEGCISVRPIIPDSSGVKPGDRITVALEWLTGSVPQEHLTLALSLKQKNGDIAQHHWYQVFEGGSITSWPSGKRHKVEYEFGISSTMPAGTYELYAWLLPLGRNTPNPLSAHLYDINLHPRDLPNTIDITKAENLDIVFENTLHLAGHTIYRSPDTLRILLSWIAIHNNNKELKTFIHIYNDRGVLVSQADTFPQEWTFNTNIWSENVIILDEISIPLSDLGPGSYKLGLGLYEISTRIRSPITLAGEGIEYANDIVILSEFTIK
jgi:hypothetical protein